LDGSATYTLGWIDYTIIVAYFIGVLAHGVYVSRKNESADDYFLAGGTLPWWLIGFSLYASNMSGSSFVGLMGAAYNSGIAVYNYEWTAVVVLIFFAVIMLPRYLNSGFYTVPEFLSARFDNRPRMAFSIFTLIAIMFIDTAGALYAGGLVITSVMPFLELWQAVAIMALIAGIYTILGGLGAVVVTDMVQSVLLILGALLIFVFGLQAVGGWSEMARQLEPGQMELIKPTDDGFLPWPGLLGVILLGFYYFTLNQFVVQRVLGARTLDQARKGALFAGLLKLPNLFIMILPGVFAIILYPELNSPDLAFPTLAFDLLPIGLRGIVMAALIAAIMSSLDSALNAAGTLVTMDVVRFFRPNTPGHSLVRMGRVVTGVVMLFGAVYAPSIAGFESLFRYFQSSLAYIVPPVVVVYLGGIFFAGLTAGAAFWTIILGLCVGIPLFIAQQATGIWTETFGLPPVHFTYMAIAMMAFAMVSSTLLSLAGPRSQMPRQSLIHNARPEVSLPFYQDYRVQAFLLALATAAAIAYFW
jgi:SSS family solute:Na+ symporter